MAPTRQVMAATLGKMPTTWMRRLISPLSRSSGLVEWSSAGDPWEGHIGEHVGLGFVRQGGEFGHLGPELVGNTAPLGAGGFGIVLGEGGTHEFGHHAPAAQPACASTLRRSARGSAVRRRAALGPPPP